MKFNTRDFISLLLTLLFLVISLTGVVLYISPAGRVANWTNWTIMGFTKTQWGAIHTLASFLFVLIALIHIIYNWRVLLTYVKNRITHTFQLKMELLGALLVTGIIWIGSASAIPPFSTVMNIGESIRVTWEENEITAPAPHTELKTLEEVIYDLSMDSERVLDKLSNNGVAGASLDKTLATIAAENGISPGALYTIIQKRGDGSGRHD